MERKVTPQGKSYWGDDGAYSKEFHELWDKLVPKEGEADNVHGELIRCFSHLNYEAFNNGNGNAVEEIKEDCPSCHGGGWEEPDEDGEREDCHYCGGDCTIVKGHKYDSFFQDLFDFLRRNFPKEEQHLLDDLENCALKDKYPEGLGEFDVYNRVGDAIGYIVMTTENKPR